MQFRNQKKPEKIEPQMAPMIDVVFLLLIFFMLTLKIISPEGDFNINMPAVAQAQPEPPKLLPDFKVRLLADAASWRFALVCVWWLSGVLSGWSM